MVTIFREIAVFLNHKAVNELIEYRDEELSCSSTSSRNYSYQQITIRENDDDRRIFDKHIINNKYLFFKTYRTFLSLIEFLFYQIINVTMEDLFSNINIGCQYITSPRLMDFLIVSDLYDLESISNVSEFSTSTELSDFNVFKPLETIFQQKKRLQPSNLSQFKYHSLNYQEFSVSTELSDLIQIA